MVRFRTHCCSVAKLYLTFCDLMDCSTPGSSVVHYLLETELLKLLSIELVILPNHLNLCCALEPILHFFLIQPLPKDKY